MSVFQRETNSGSSPTIDNKRNLVSADHFSSRASSKRSFDSIGYFSDMEQALKRTGPGISRRLAATGHASDLSRPKEAFDAVERHAVADSDAKPRRSSSVDQLRDDDDAPFKRVFDSIGGDMSDLRKRFDSIAHYSDMNDMKRN